jgi:hypothetical protein
MKRRREPVEHDLLAPVEQPAGVMSAADALAYAGRLRDAEYMRGVFNALAGIADFEGDVDAFLADMQTFADHVERQADRDRAA